MIMLCFDVQTVVVFHETSRAMVGMIAVMAVMKIAELIVVRSYKLLILLQLLHNCDN